MLKTKLAALAVATAVVATTGVSVYAAPNAGAKGGEIIVYEDTGLIESVVDADNEGISTQGVTSGTVDSGDEKGYWIRGSKKYSGVKHVYSSYKNYKKQGAASVTNGEGDYKDGGFKPADTMSTAHVKWTSAGTNKANYRYK